jgi:hypothetical protein
MRLTSPNVDTLTTYSSAMYFAHKLSPTDSDLSWVALYSCHFPPLSEEQVMGLAVLLGICVEQKGGYPFGGTVPAFWWSNDPVS